MNKEQLDPFVDFCMSYAKDALEEPGAEVFSPVIGIWKDNKCYVWLFPRESGRNAVLEVAWPSILCLEPDFITLLLDTFMVKSQTKKDGSPWEQGDMQKAVENNTEDAELVSSQLMVQIFDRLGNANGVSVLYEITDGVLTWGERTHWNDEEGASWDGYMVEVIREAFQQPTMRQKITEAAALEEQLPDLAALTPTVGMTSVEALAYLQDHPEESYAHLICAAVKSVLLPYLGALAVAAGNESMAEIFEESLGSIPGVTSFGPEEFDESP